MAQYHVIFRWFEQNWRPRVNFAAKVLRDFKESWLPSTVPFPTRDAVAVVLNIFAFDFYEADFMGYRGVHPDELKKRPLDEWVRLVGTPETECAQLAPAQTESACVDMVEALCGIVADATGSWERASDEPSCESLANQMLDELGRGRFVTVSRG